MVELKTKQIERKKNDLSEIPITFFTNLHCLCALIKFFFALAAFIEAIKGWKHVILFIWDF